MSILYLLIPLSLLLLSLAVAVFFWAVKSGQFDDLEGPAHRILFDDDDNDLTPEQRRRKAQGETPNRDSSDSENHDHDTRPPR
ncbi:cytochrome oxidase maturation protein, cbb3-type [Modicisalibacter muralis]|uniref:Cytochrome oxidase maturation protein, cbb3-type n=1 Tax=Modicisalibacter muralis TaxID=119000 RepID=A0A1G9IXH1_9GAMM|nr:cbb3-type cytochrome oxidase assembly protein CcoS [Halomonas muralis]SDL29940.1 cytochrome oxidase maturation protein, cbb3-type [Halomonas muralis]